MEEKIARFEELMSKVNREGVDKLMNVIRKSDFYRAPASTKFHGSYEGGLLTHTLNVYDCLIAKKESPLWKKVFEEQGYTEENLIISALLHDLCKVNYYVKDYRNQKNRNLEVVENRRDAKVDEIGKFVWESVPFYKVEDRYTYGHGEKSVMLAEEFITLKPCERYAIRWHMGAYDVSPSQMYTIGNAIEKYPLALALQEADQEATHLLEVE